MKNSAESHGRLGKRPGAAWLGRGAALLLTGLAPGLAAALTAGQISVQSYLNEPFRATVPLSALQLGEAQELKVGLASDAAYRSLGLEKSLFLTSLQFNVREGASADQARLVITSTETAKEPFFSVLLSFEGMSGTLVREYTILLDPNTGDAPKPSAPRVAIEAPAAAAPLAPQPAPVVRAAPQPAAAPVTQPVVRERSVSPAVQPFRSGDAERKVPVPTPSVVEGAAVVSGDESAPAPVVYQNQPVSYASQFGPVEPGMTLWQIAAAVRPDPSVTMNQVMWGLYSANPDQFDGNLNLVKRGAVLQVPSVQALRDVSPAEANALVADEAQRHRDALSGSTAPAAPAAAPQQLELERPKAVAPSRPVATAPAASASAPQAKPQQPQIPEPTQQPLKLVEDKSPAKQPTSVLPAAEPAVQDEAAYEELEALPAQDAEDAEYAELPGLPVDADDEDLLVEDDAAELDAAMPQTETDTDDAEQYPNLFGLALAALGVLILGLLVVFGLRRRNQGSDQGPVSDFSSARPAQRKPVSDFAAPTATAATAAAAGESLDDTMAFDATATSDLDDTLTQDLGTAQTEGGFDATQDFDIPDLDDFVSGAEPKASADPLGDTVQFDEPQTPAIDFGDTEVSAAEPALSEPAAEEMDFSELEMDNGTQTLDLGSETVSLELNEDPLSEADFQLAYGLYDEAALLLNRAIEAEPDRLELHEKLAETHFAASDADKFKQAAETLKARGPDAETWQRIAIMGQQLCPGDALFGELDAAGDGAVDLDMAFDSGDAAPTDSADNALEFSLDDAPVDQPEAASQAPQDNVLEFELDETADSPEVAASGVDDDFEADFGDFSADDEAAADDLPDLDELNLDDLEAELDVEPQLEAEAPAEEPVSEAPDAAADDFADLTLSDVSDTELGLDTQTGDASDVVGTGTDFQLEEPQFESEVESDFSIDMDEQPASSADELTLADIDLGDEAPTQDDTAGFELDAADDGLSLDDGGLTLDDGDLALDAGGDLDLGDLDLGAGDDEAQASDFNLDDLSLDDSADAGDDLADFTLDDDSDLSADLSGEETDFNLDDLGSDAGDVAGGDESATKLDLARAYVDMGESDMARSLLEEVVAGGSDEQKANAQELLSKL